MWEVLVKRVNKDVSLSKRMMETMRQLSRFSNNEHFILKPELPVCLHDRRSMPAKEHSLADLAE